MASKVRFTSFKSRMDTAGPTAYYMGCKRVKRQETLYPAFGFSSGGNCYVTKVIFYGINKSGLSPNVEPTNFP